MGPSVEKPSFSFHASGRTCTLSRFSGSEVGPKATCQPLAVLGSSTMW